MGWWERRKRRKEHRRQEKARQRRASIRAVTRRPEKLEPHCCPNCRRAFADWDNYTRNFASKWCPWCESRVFKMSELFVATDGTRPVYEDAIWFVQERKRKADRKEQAYGMLFTD